MYTYYVEIRDTLKAIAESPDFSADIRYHKAVLVAKQVWRKWGRYGCESFAIWTALRTLIVAASRSTIFVPERYSDEKFAETLKCLSTQGVCDPEALMHGLVALRRHVTD
jgi:hypothetical protein